jgi:hypothetical protein
MSELLIMSKGTSKAIVGQAQPTLGPHAKIRVLFITHRVDFAESFPDGR